MRSGILCPIARIFNGVIFTQFQRLSVVGHLKFVFYIAKRAGSKRSNHQAVVCRLSGVARVRLLRNDRLVAVQLGRHDIYRIALDCHLPLHCSAGSIHPCDHAEYIQRIIDLHASHSILRHMFCAAVRSAIPLHIVHARISTGRVNHEGDSAVNGNLCRFRSRSKVVRGFLDNEFFPKLRRIHLSIKACACSVILVIQHIRENLAAWQCIRAKAAARGGNTHAISPILYIQFAKAAALNGKLCVCGAIFHIQLVNAAALQRNDSAVGHLQIADMTALQRKAPALTPIKEDILNPTDFLAVGNRQTHFVGGLECAITLNRHPMPVQIDRMRSAAPCTAANAPCTIHSGIIAIQLQCAAVCQPIVDGFLHIGIEIAIHRGYEFAALAAVFACCYASCCIRFHVRMQAFYDLDVVDRRALKCRFVLHIRPICILVRIAICKQFTKFDRPKTSCPNLIKAAAAQFGLCYFRQLIIPERQFSDRTRLRSYDYCGFPRFCFIVRVIRYIDRADRTAFPLAQIQRSFQINGDYAAIHRRFITAFADDLQGAGRISPISIFAPNIKPSACDLMSIQIQRNRCIIAGNTRSARNQNIRQQGDFCAVHGRLHRRLKVCAVGHGPACLALHGHLRAADGAFRRDVSGRVRALRDLVRTFIPADGAYAVLKLVMRADIAAGADVHPIFLRKRVLRMLHDHQSHVGNMIHICGIHVGHIAVVRGIRLSAGVIAVPLERRTRGQIVRQVLALRDLQTVDQRCARFERQIAALQNDRGIGDVGRTACRLAADHDRVSLYRHAAALNPDAVASHGGGTPLLERSVFQRHAAAGDGQRDAATYARKLDDIGQPCLPVQVNGKRAARDGDVFRHILRQRHRAAVRRFRRRVDGCLQGGVHCPVVLRRLFYTADTSSVLPEGVLLISGSPAAIHAALFVGQAVGVGGVLHCMVFRTQLLPADAVNIVLSFTHGDIFCRTVGFRFADCMAQLAGLRVLVVLDFVLPLMLAALGDGDGGAVGVAGIARSIRIVCLDALHARSDFDSHCPFGIGAVSDGRCALAARLGRYRAAGNVHRHGARVIVFADRADTGAANVC